MLLTHLKYCYHFQEANARITRVSSASRDDHVNERRPLLQDNDGSDREDHTSNAPDSS